VSGWVLIGATGLLLVAWHLLRLVQLNDAAAQRWLRARSFDPTPNQVRDVRAHLRRLRVSRVVGALVMLLLAGLSYWLAEVPIGVVSAPYLMSTLVAEVLAPRPRTPRERAASLAPRPAGYFAPRRAVVAGRVVLVLGTVLSAVALTRHGETRALAAVHLAGTVAVLLLFERCLRVISDRGLPQASSDAQVDTALRVADSRLACAAALVYGAVGLSLAIAYSHVAAWHPAGLVLDALLAVGQPALLVAVVLLVSPQRSWYPPPEGPA
jgi:hypothetical protein